MKRTRERAKWPPHGTTIRLIALSRSNFFGDERLFSLATQKVFRAGVRAGGVMETNSRGNEPAAILIHARGPRESPLT